MKVSNSKLVEQSLSKPDIHRQWESAYRNERNERFYEQAFDYITHVLNIPENSTFLDAGCGICAHAIRLANRGFFVQAIDFSDSILKKAAANLNATGFENRIKIRRENIIELSFENETFENILCWGVLMHIPDLEKAISELKSKGVEFTDEIHADEMIKLIKFLDPCKNQLQLVEVLITDE